MRRTDDRRSRHRQGPPRRRPLGVLGVLLATALLLGPAGPASAHDGLDGTQPADGAVLDAAPDQVVLTFTADQLAVGAAVAVTGPDGVERADGAPVVAGPTVTQALARDMPGGAYTVEWRSVSGDGHPTGGTFTFTLALPAVVTPTPPASSPASALTASPSPAAVPAPRATIDAVVEADAPPGGPGAPLVVAGVVVLLLVAAGIAVAVRRRGRAG